ncbi:MAG TPA: DEAD/DEAH box helicase [Sporichthya sp.]|nr:DEAD/DEAH box helicase [Sporichthya sp.]
MRTKFQSIAMLVRQERARLKTDSGVGEAARSEMLRRLDGIATILAQTAAREPSLLALLAEDAVVSTDTRTLLREMMTDAGLEVPEEEVAPPPPVAAANPAAERRVVPQSVVQRQLANPFLEPDFSAAPRPAPAPARMLSTWELLEPLYRAFEEASGGVSSCMTLPPTSTMHTAHGVDLMPHQAQVVAAAAAGHRTFLLADEPGLGKTAQALLAAQAVNAYPLLAVVPNVVKTNWAREVAMWTPSKKATVIHGDGDTIDGFADVVVVNYEVLDRHVGWIGDFGFRAMVVDEAHFIKNKSSLRSKNVLELADRIRARTVRPLMMALTGTPLINDIEDFQAIWEFLGWIDAKKPRAELMHALEETGWTPIDREFYPAARQCVIDLGIVRRRKVDVAADIPARRIADLPVELDDKLGKSIKQAEQRLAKRMVSRYQAALEARTSGSKIDSPDGIDHDLVRLIATRERKEAKESKTEGNVFGLMRKIGQSKAVLAADYAAQLARSAGKVVFFAKHIDVMDAAEETFTKAGIKFSSIRGDQTTSGRQKQVDAFVNDPDVAVCVCSLTAAGVGINLQVASNIVLAELSWTDAEQTQAIDRCHRIGQTMPVTAWRIIAAQTIDARVAELIDSKAGLAARALDGSDEEITSVDVQLEALVSLLTDALTGA